METSKYLSRVLVIAGSDSSGGAGIQADLKVLTAHGVYGMTAITALTSQNTQEVNGIEVMDSQFVRKQIDTCIEDIGIDVLKTGMLASPEIVAEVAAAIDRHKLINTVVDPVMVSTSGSVLLSPSAVETYAKLLLPRTLILTPNRDEARLLLCQTNSNCSDSKDDAMSLARDIKALGPSYVLVKGGQCPYMENLTDANTIKKKFVIDILYDGSRFWEFKSEFVDSTSTHGTGCSLAAAIASNLALSQPVIQAVENAIHYVQAALSEAVSLGKGHGPINHTVSIYRLPFYKGKFYDYLIRHPKICNIWTEYVDHSFVRQLAEGTLDKKAFMYYLVQDYMWLRHYARAHSLAGYKASTLSQSASSAAIVLYIEREIVLHKSFFDDFGISENDINTTPESVESMAYSRYLLDLGLQGDWMGLQVGLSPCLLGYGVIAKRLLTDSKIKRENNPYHRWIENYAGQDYERAVRLGQELLEEHALKQSTSRIAELVDIFAHATRLEAAFWQMGLDYVTKLMNT
ncbi:putative hydroxymethylpyrimidine/phosphomethylpyrimidine kinase 2 isoform B [Neolecta irregularis DAH-3]|uniref:Putative hydroxymethylpyrimidine/phosphomethylpyrimidine kinase 2 isoform A n=1 Tax=Neolecta irregularis (strain DAH-3) TaxID=1198029 RepID=A0A1U7LPB5_NEOID|nr:putative hydroxymethylpyrimidine/phosphomethylpyrimidine kinase 2 isoform A [Neolecta irregularis DAH-3]OLL24496.1 putative hydroxymethylpyrimidine/phosphomethylpyrimidine kinase 2 isoform B [Neolecta irregularis DAH-3]|eukprot:OLL24495.1 putative hydroxymethylpyrimidine/phosphomethylpyrimidine kinase 2 isoform A [Neolecta irregularis DAH-3]